MGEQGLEGACGGIGLEVAHQLRQIFGNLAVFRLMWEPFDNAHIKLRMLFWQVRQLLRHRDGGVVMRFGEVYSNAERSGNRCVHVSTGFLKAASISASENALPVMSKKTL